MIIVKLSYSVQGHVIVKGERKGVGGRCAGHAFGIALLVFTVLVMGL